MATILVIEDDTNIRQAIVDILEFAGYEPLSAADGITGVKIARSQRPDLVVCDVTMPFLDGYGVLKQLRQDSSLPVTPFIFLTAHATKADQRAGMELSADDYLTKPFDEEELLNAIQTRLERKARLSNSLESRIDLLRHDITRSLPQELRSLLEGIVAGTAFLRDEMMPKDDLREIADVVYLSSLRLDRLVHNHLLYLELSLAAAEGRFAVKAAKATPTQVVPFIETIAPYEASLAGHERDLRLNVGAATVSVAPEHLTKIISELLNNAFKFSDPGTAIEVSTRLNGALTLCVTDYGRGMSAEQISAISAAAPVERAGLGLAIVKLLAESYDGTMQITSTVGRQTTVCVTLPLG